MGQARESLNTAWVAAELLSLTEGAFRSFSAGRRIPLVAPEPDLGRIDRANLHVPLACTALQTIRANAWARQSGVRIRKPLQFLYPPGVGDEWNTRNRIASP